MRWQFWKPRAPDLISAETLDLAKTATAKITPEELRAIRDVSASKTLWPGLIAYAFQRDHHHI